MKGKFHVRLYKLGDSRNIVGKDIFDNYPKVHERIESLNLVQGNLIYTCFEDHAPIGILGASFLYPGVVDLWSYLSMDVKKYPLAFYKTVINLLKFGNEGLNIFRIQMVVKDGRPELIKWAESLGMICEGKLRKFGPDKSDYLMFARVN